MCHLCAGTVTETPTVRRVHVSRRTLASHGSSVSTVSALNRNRVGIVTRRVFRSLRINEQFVGVGCSTGMSPAWHREDLRQTPAARRVQVRRMGAMNMRPPAPRTVRLRTSQVATLGCQVGDAMARVRSIGPSMTMIASGRLRRSLQEPYQHRQSSPLPLSRVATLIGSGSGASSCFAPRTVGGSSAAGS